MQPSPIFSDDGMFCLPTLWCLCLFSVSALVCVLFQNGIVSPYTAKSVRTDAFGLGVLSPKDRGSASGITYLLAHPVN
jgi:hypothetical protein